MSGPSRFAVVIRTCDRPRMLERALESVAGQTWRELEAVVVNDGGDDVERVVAPFRERLDLRLLQFPAERKPGRCLAATRAIEASEGDWIAYLDDDDAWYPEHLASIAEGAHATGARVVYTDSERAIEEPDPRGGYRVREVVPGPSVAFSRVELYCGCHLHLSAFAHARSVFERHGGFDPSLPVLEDFDLFLRYSRDEDFHHVPRCTARYHVRTDETNAITAMRREFEETTATIAQKYLHLAVNDVLEILKAGRSQVAALVDAVGALGARVEELEKTLARSEEPKG